MSTLKIHRMTHQIFFWNDEIDLNETTKSLLISSKILSIYLVICDMFADPEILSESLISICLLVWLPNWNTVLIQKFQTQMNIQPSIEH